MTVTSGYKHPRTGMIRHELVADAVSGIVEALYSFIPDNIPYLLILSCQLRIARRCIVIHDNHQSGRIKDMYTSHFLEGVVDARCIIMSQYYIRTCKYNSTC